MNDFDYIDMEVELEVEFGTIYIHQLFVETMTNILKSDICECWSYFIPNIYFLFKTSIKEYLCLSDLWIFESHWQDFVTVKDVIDFVTENAGNRQFNR